MEERRVLYRDGAGCFIHLRGGIEARTAEKITSEVSSMPKYRDDRYNYPLFPLYGTFPVALSEDEGELEEEASAEDVREWCDENHL